MFVMWIGYHKGGLDTCASMLVDVICCYTYVKIRLYMEQAAACSLPNRKTDNCLRKVIMSTYAK